MVPDTFPNVRLRRVLWVVVRLAPALAFTFIAQRIAILLAVV